MSGEAGVARSGFRELDPGASGLHAAWYAANVAAGEVTAQRCECGVFRAPARYRCAACASDQWTFEPLAPDATVVSWTVTRRPVHPSFLDVVPYGIVVAEISPEVRLLLQYRGPADELVTGAAVRVSVDSFGVPYAVPLG